MVASGPEASVVNYSERFTLTNMTGAFSPPIVHGIHSAIHSLGSPINEGEEHEELRKRQMIGSYTIPYPLQTGPTRYAPMAKKPGSTIPAGLPTPQFSASPYTIATTYLPAATVQVTLSASETYSVVSIENTVSIASADLCKTALMTPVPSKGISCTAFSRRANETVLRKMEGLGRVTIGTCKAPDSHFYSNCSIQCFFSPSSICPEFSLIMFFNNCLCAALKRWWNGSWDYVCT